MPAGCAVVDTLIASVPLVVAMESLELSSVLVERDLVDSRRVHDVLSRHSTATAFGPL